MLLLWFLLVRVIHMLMLLWVQALPHHVAHEAGPVVALLGGSALTADAAAASRRQPTGAAAAAAAAAAGKAAGRGLLSVDLGAWLQPRRSVPSQPAAAAAADGGEGEDRPVCVEVTKGRRRVYRRRKPAAASTPAESGGISGTSSGRAVKAQQQQQPGAGQGQAVVLGGAAALCPAGFEIQEDQLTHRHWLRNAVNDFLLPQVHGKVVLAVGCALWARRRRPPLARRIRSLGCWPSARAPSHDQPPSAVAGSPTIPAFFLSPLPRPAEGIPSPVAPQCVPRGGGGLLLADQLPPFLFSLSPFLPFLPHCRRASPTRWPCSMPPTWPGEGCSTSLEGPSQSTRPARCWARWAWPTSTAARRRRRSTGW